MANRYVRPTTTGTPGTTAPDWNNAWSMAQVNSNQSNINPGDTVWIAAGTHGANLIATKSGSSGSPITYSAVLASDAAPASANGFLPAFVVTSSNNIKFPNNSVLDFEANWVTVDGRVTDGMLWQLTTGGDACHLSEAGNGNNNCRLIHCTIIGPYNGNNGATYGISWWNGGGTFGRLNNYIGYCTFRGLSDAMKWSNNDGTIVEHCYIADTYVSSNDHEDTIYSYAQRNCIIRYNVFNNSPNDGMFNDDGGDTSAVLLQNYHFYGNVVYNYSGWCIVSKNTGAHAGPVFIYNNTFYSPPGTINGDMILSFNGLNPQGVPSRLFNNIFINVTMDMGLASVSNVQLDYNAYNSGSGGLSAHDGSHSFLFTFNANEFVNIASNPNVSQTPNVGNPAGNYRLTPAGVPLFQGKGIAQTVDGFINFDADGNSRGGSTGAWDVGAFVASGGGGGGPVFGTSRLAGRSVASDRASITHDAKLII